MAVYNRRSFKTLIEPVSFGEQAMETSLIQQGSNLMLYGMGVVFVFLTLLVVMVTALSAVLRRFFPETEATTGAASATGINTGAGVVVADDRIRKVVQAAIDQHRSR